MNTVPIYPNIADTYYDPNGIYYYNVGYIPQVQNEPLPVKQEIHDRLVVTLLKSQNLADAILEPKKDEQESSSSLGCCSCLSSIIAALPRTFIYNNSSWNTYYDNSTVIQQDSNNNYRRGGRDKDDKSTNMLVTVVAAAIFFGILAVGGFLIGRNSSVLAKDSKKLADFDKDIKWWNGSDPFKKDGSTIADNYNYRMRYKERVEDVMEAAHSILNREYKNSLLNVALSVGVVATGALGLLGIVLSTPVLVTTALVIGAVVVLGATVKAGYNCYDTGHQEDAQGIRKNLLTLHTLGQQQAAQPYSVQGQAYSYNPTYRTPEQRPVYTSYDDEPSAPLYPAQQVYTV